MPTEQTNIVPGEILEGRVQGITKFGAFIELPGGAVGLVHISEIANTYVKDVKDFIQEGDTVKVKVLNVAGKKIGLSVKQARPDEEKRVAPREAGNIQRPGGFHKPGGFQRPAAAGDRQHFQANNRGGGSPMSLDDKIAKFLKESDERMQPLKNKQEHRRRRNNQ